MSTVFHWLKRICACLGLITTTFFCGYATYLDQAYVIQEPKHFYFLVSNAENVMVGAHFAQLNGGAGYVFSYKKQPYAVLAVYMSETEGEMAQISVMTAGEAATLLEVPLGDLYFKSSKEKKNADTIAQALNVYYDNIIFLQKTISLLDNGMTQEKTKRLLNESARQFSFLAKKYAIVVPSWEAECQNIATTLRRYDEEIVTAQELRGDLCSFCAVYLELRKHFSL